MADSRQHNEQDIEQCTSLPSLERGRGERLLCIRFSAIGDVAMTVPVVKAFALAHPDIQVVMVSRPFAKAFYEDLADNVSFVGFDLKDERYKGMLGMEHLYQDIAKLKPDMVADLHDVIRTKYIRMRFMMRGIPVAHIDKHRAGRKALTRKENKVLEQQPTSFEKYAAVLSAVTHKQFDVSLDSAPLHFEGATVFKNLLPSGRSGGGFPSYLSGGGFPSYLSGGGFLGIAPFAAHEGKIYPTDKMEQVIQLLSKRHPNLNIILFGGGPKEKEVFDKWCHIYNKVEYAGNICHGMREELALMQQLECMVSMDSGNMHMASLVGTPVISIWGATHPLAGFMGWGQKPDDVLQVDLPCRPCCIYGNKPCLRGDYACLNNITPQQIVEKVERYIEIS